MDDSVLRSAHRDAYEDCGVVCVRQALSHAELAMVLEELEDYIENVVPTLDTGMLAYETAGNHAGVVRSLFWMNSKSDFFRELANNERLRGIVRSVVGWEPLPHYVEYFAKPPRIGAALHVHQDAPSVFLDPPESAVLWIALDRALAENGGVHFYARSQRLGLLPHNYADDWFLTVEDMRALQGYEPVCFDLAPGDASIHGSATVHYSPPNRSALPRRGLGIGYRSPTARLNEEAARQHLGFEWPR